MGDAALAIVAGMVVVGLVAFRRARGVLPPEARKTVAKQDRRTRRRETVSTLLAVSRAAVGVAALAGIVWLARELFA